MHRIVLHSHRRNILYSLLDYFDCRLRQKSMVLNWLQQRNAPAMALMIMMIRAIPYACTDVDASGIGKKTKAKKKVKLEKVAYARVVYDIYYWNPKYKMKRNRIKGTPTYTQAKSWGCRHSNKKNDHVHSRCNGFSCCSFSLLVLSLSLNGCPIIFSNRSILSSFLSLPSLFNICILSLWMLLMLSGRECVYHHHCALYVSAWIKWISPSHSLLFVSWSFRLPYLRS